MEKVAKRHGGNRKPQTFRDCRGCGERFGPLERLSQQFCSHKCKVKAQRAKPSRKYGRSYPHLRRAPERKCPACLGMFRAVKDTQRYRQVYCSHNCYLRCRSSSLFEAAVGAWMEARGIKLLRQVRSGRWTFDFMLMGTMIAVEADGVYWHSSPAVRARDARKTTYCEGQEITLLRVTDIDFALDPVWAMSVIVTRWEEATGKKAELARKKR